MKPRPAWKLPRLAHLEGLDRYEPGMPIEQVERELGLSRVVKLASNENPLGPAPGAVKALESALDQLHRYPDGPATGLRQALAEGLGVEPSQVAIGNGSSDLIGLLARTFLGPEDNAVISEAAFARFHQAVQARNGGARLVPMRELTHDLPALRAAIDARTRLVFVANPNNPTGTWNGRDEVEQLIDTLPAHVVLVLDEAYFEYAAAEQPDYPNGLDYVRQGAPVIVLRTFSKVYGLAGLRVGYGVSLPAIIDAIEAVREPFNSSSLAQLGALAALRDEEHVRRTVELNRAEKPRVRAALMAKGLRVLPSLGNFLCVDTARDGRRAFEALLRRGVIVRPLGGYNLASWLRVSIGTPEQNGAFLDAMEQVLAEVPSRR